tara:strand:+ start:30240 stop:31337 length:1098 start_codon:yes stop_codon:yes gene_type:complete
MKKIVKKCTQYFGYELVKKTIPTTSQNGNTVGHLLSHRADINIFQYIDPSLQDSEKVSSFKNKIKSKSYSICSYPCAICKHNNFSSVARSPEGFQWGVCTNCGLLQLYARLESKALNKFYESGEYQVICMNNLDDKMHYQLEYQVNSLCFLDIFEKLNIPITNKHILEIGCGSAGILRALQEQGAHVQGFDIDPYRVDVGKKHVPNLYVKDAMDESFKLPLKIDYIILSNILEHLNSPHSFLDNLSKKIHSSNNALNTKLLIDIPNLETASEYSPNGFAYFLHIAHLWYFNSITVERLLNTCGFKIDYIFSRESSFTIIASISESPIKNNNNAYWNSISAINYANYTHDNNNLRNKVKEKLEHIL